MQTVDHRTEFTFGYIHFFLEDITPLCLYFAKLKQLECKRILATALANRYYSMLGLGNVEVLW